MKKRVCYGLAKSDWPKACRAKGYTKNNHKRSFAANKNITSLCEWGTNASLVACTCSQGMGGYYGMQVGAMHDLWWLSDMPVFPISW